MIERLENLPAGVHGLDAKGKVTKEDYETFVGPLLDDARREGGRIRLLYRFGPEFEGFTAGAAWEDARRGLQNLRSFERCAVMTDAGWLRESTRLLAALIPCPMKVFANDELQKALEWLAAPAPRSVLSYQLQPENGVLVVNVSGSLATEDFEAIALTVDPWIEMHGELQGIVVHAEKFPRWEDLGSLLRHLRFVRDHHRKVRRVALVADGHLAKLAPDLADHFVAAELKHFDHDKPSDALKWAQGDAA